MRDHSKNKHLTLHFSIIKLEEHMKKILESERDKSLQPFLSNGWLYIVDRDAITKQFIFQHRLTILVQVLKSVLLDDIDL